jgi:hypothetical protein
MKKLLQIAVLMFICASITSCGYTTSSALPSRLKTIYVEPFGNKIDFTSANRRNVYFPLIEVTAKNKIVERFLFDGNLRIADKEDADLVLEANLVSYSRSALRYDDNDDVLEYRVQIAIELVLMDVEKQEPFLSEGGFYGESDYFLTGAESVTEEVALDLAISDLAKRLVERIIENW